MAAVPEAIAILDVVTGFPTPITHLTIVLAPCMDSLIAYSDLSPMASLAFEVRSLVHVAVDTMANASYGVSSGKTVQALVHGQAFILERLFQGSDAVGNLMGFGVVAVEVLDFAL